QYCCTGEYAYLNTCKPTLFAYLFKAICPKAYSYAFDDSSTPVSTSAGLHAT
ncbi:unnamed protein product, partial [Linum tenue]